MSLHAHLIHRCTIQRGAKAITAYRNDARTWSDHLLDVPCRLVEKAQRVFSHERAQLVVVTTYTLLLPRETDVIPDDRITQITEGKTTVDAGPFTIKAVLTRRTRSPHHLSLALERAS